MTNDEIRVLTSEIDQLHARRDKQANKLQRAEAAHGAAEQERQRLSAGDDNDAKLTAAIKQAADCRLAVDAAREALGMTQDKLDETEQRLATAKDLRRRAEIVKDIDDRLERLQQGRRDLDKAARAFCDVLADASLMGRGVATQVMAGISMADGSFAELLNQTRNYQARVRTGLEPKLAGDEHAAHA